MRKEGNARYENEIHKKRYNDNTELFDIASNCHDSIFNYFLY